jgi:hypothetical protein
MVTLGHRKFTPFGKIATAVALSAAFCSAHAQNAKEQASNAAIADGVSKAVSLAVRASDLNPVGPILGIGMTAAMFQYAESLPEAERPGAYAFAASVWQGTTANNLCLTAAVLTGGSFTPVCIALGVAWGMKTWNDSEHERRFWERCAILREFSDQPDFPCVYTPPDKDAVMEASSGTVVSWSEFEAP